MVKTNNKHIRFRENDLFDVRFNASFLNNEIIQLDNTDYLMIFDYNTDIDIKNKILITILSNVFLGDYKSQIRAREIYNFLLNKNSGYDDVEIEFINYYTVFLNYCSMKFDENGRVKDGYMDARMPGIVVSTAKDKEELADCYAYYDSIDNVIFVNEDSSILPFKDGKQDKLFAYLQCLCHEMVHFKQIYEMRKGILSVSAFNGILYYVISNQFFDKDSSNYRFRRAEVEAQIESMKYVVDLAKEFFPDYIEFQDKMLNEREDYLIDEALSMQYDDEDAIVLRDFYDIAGLSVAVSKNPDDYLMGYPQLLSFFDSSGQMCSEEELLMGYMQMKMMDNPIEKIYEDFLVYIYHKDSAVNNYDLPSDLLDVKKEFITNQVKRELINLRVIRQMIKNSQTAVDSDEIWNKKYTEVIINMRTKRLKSYYDFLSGMIINRSDNVLEDLVRIIDMYEDIINGISKEVSLYGGRSF